MKQLTVRKVSEEIARALKQERLRRGISLNQLVLELLRQSLGLGSNRYDNGLSKLAGTWSAAELLEFNEQMSSLNQIDSELWQ
jgi:hypothetical protein